MTTATCGAPVNVTQTSLRLTGNIQGVPLGGSVRFRYGTTLNGPYNTIVPAGPYANGGITADVTGLTAGTAYHFITEVLDASNTVVATSTDCTASTLSATNGGCQNCMDDCNGRKLSPGAAQAVALFCDLSAGPNCPSPSWSIEIVCDASGKSMYAVLLFCNGAPQAGSVPSFFDFTGAAVTPVLPIGACTGADWEDEILCDRGNSNHQFIRRFSLDKDGNLIPELTGNFELDGITPYTIVGPVGTCTAGDFEQNIFCDTSVDPPKPFISRVRFDENGDLIPDQTGTYELDGVTPYAPVGPITVCGGDVVDTEITGPVCEIDTAGNIVGYYWHKIFYRGQVQVATNLVGYKLAAPQAWIDPYTIGAGNTSGACESTALPPQTFCFKGSVTAPQDLPGRSFSGTLSISRGFTVDSVAVGGTVYPLSITWSVLDLDGTAFAAALQTAIQNKIPGSTVAIAPVGISPCTVTPQNFTINVACIKQAVAPVSIDLKYDGGTDLIQNAGFKTTVPLGGLSQVKRQDNGGTIQCTNVANRGWETNDPQGTFEIWPPGFLGITPTPRGTQIQEINSNAIDTIWQTIVVPADGTYTLKATVGGRGATQPIVVRLSTGDTNAGGSGDKLNVTVNATSVTGGTGKPWTNLTQNVALTAGTYTLSLKGPPTVGVGGLFTDNQDASEDEDDPEDGPPTVGVGGLFTDLRLYTSLPSQVKSLTPDNTCLITENVTTETSDCQIWIPTIGASGTIISWLNPKTGSILSNTAFWAQIPAPTCCTSEGGGSPDITAPNLLAWYPVCGTVSGVETKLIRQLILDQSGGGISEQFVGADGAIIVPDSWIPGDCPEVGAAEVVCRCDDTDGDGVYETPFKSIVQIDSTGVTTVLASYEQDLLTPYTPVNPGTCGVPGDNLIRAVPGYKLQSGAGVWTLNADSTAPTVSVTFTVIAVGNVATPPTVTTYAGTFGMVQGQSQTWSATYSRDVSGLKPPLVLTTGPGDVVAVGWTQEAT